MGQTVLIVDDHAGFRSSAKRMLEADGFEVLGEAGDGERGIAAARELAPDVVLLDLQLPGIDGLEVAARLTAGNRTPAVVLTSTRDGVELGSLVSRSGARGFIPKQELSGSAIAELLE